MSFLTDSISEVHPAMSTMMEMIMALKYSTRPYPKGCLRSAGRSESLVPTMVMTDDMASLRLLSASIMMAVEFAMRPTAVLNEAKNRLAAMPMALVLMISVFLLMLYGEIGRAS